MSEREQTVRQFIEENPKYRGMQTFDCRNVVNDPMSTILAKNGVTIDYCYFWSYLEIFGLTKEEYQNLADILDIC